MEIGSVCLYTKTIACTTVISGDCCQFATRVAGPSAPRQLPFHPVESTNYSPFFRSSGFPFLTEATTMSPEAAAGSRFNRAPTPLTAMTKRFLAPELSAQLKRKVGARKHLVSIGFAMPMHSELSRLLPSFAVLCGSCKHRARPLTTVSLQPIIHLLQPPRILSCIGAMFVVHKHFRDCWTLSSPTLLHQRLLIFSCHKPSCESSLAVLLPLAKPWPS